MSSIKQLKSGNFQLRVQSKLLPLGFYYDTFSSREEAQEYGDRFEALLKQKIVPAALLEKKPAVTSWMLSRCIAEYAGEGYIASSEIKVLDTIRPSLATESTAGLNYAWCHQWVLRMKREENLAPSTIRHRVGALRRCLDWVVRAHPEVLVTNPLGNMKRGFATYTPDDEKFLKKVGKETKLSADRNRRMHEEEEPKILAVLEKMPEERAFFILALETAMRMREIYCLTIDQVSIEKKTVSLKKTKNGDTREVPLPSPARALLTKYMSENADAIKARKGILFPFWNGKKSDADLDATTSELSRTFRRVFAAAKIEDFVFHDIRHEATCRLFLKSTLSDTLIAKITGHRDPRMLKRYASLRGSDLADRLW